MNAWKSTITTAVMFPGFCNTIFSNSIATPFPPTHSTTTPTVNPRQPPPHKKETKIRPNIAMI